MCSRNRSRRKNFNSYLTKFSLAALAALAALGGCRSGVEVIAPDTGVVAVDVTLDGTVDERDDATVTVGDEDVSTVDRAETTARTDIEDIEEIEDVAPRRDVFPLRDLGPWRRFECGSLARVEDPMGDYVFLGNPVGGTFQLVVDVAIRNVGVIVGAPIELTLNGRFNADVEAVVIVGTGAAESVVHAPSNVRVERNGSPRVSVPDVRGASTLRCLSECGVSAVPAEEGCNTVEQARAYFQSRFGEALRWFTVQRSSFDGVYVFVSRGGCCL